MPILKYYKMQYPSYNERKKLFRPVAVGTDNLKRPIALFGCSYVWGTMINENETFSALLSKKTGRTVYNRSLYATGVPFFYYQLLQDDINSEIENPEYIIYTLINDHFFRLLTMRGWCMDSVLQYKYVLKNGKLELVKPTFPQLYGLYSTFIYLNYKQKSDYQKGLYKELFLKLMKNSNNLIKKKFPDSKFIILVYQDFDWKNEQTKMNLLEELKKEGIEIIYTDDIIGKNILSDEKYRSSDNFHPSKAAWELIVPALVKKLNL